MDFVNVVHQAVEDSIGEGGVADSVMPFFERQLTGGQGRVSIQSATTCIILATSPNYDCRCATRPETPK